MDRRDDGLGVVVEQRNDLLRRRGVGDARIVAQIAEPEHGLDPVRHSALDAAPQHPPAGVPTEIGFDQGLGDAGEGCGFDREPKEGREPLQRPDLLVGEALRPIGHPRGIDAVHLADRAVFGEAVDDRHEVGDRGLAHLGEHRKFEVALGGDAPPQHRFPLVSMRKNGLVRQRSAASPFAGSSVFGQRRFRLVALPAERPPLVNGMKRVDEQDHPRERQPGGGGAAAEALEQRGLHLALEARLGEPGRKLGDLGFGHGAIITAVGNGRPTPTSAACACPSGAVTVAPDWRQPSSGLGPRLSAVLLD